MSRLLSLAALAVCLLASGRAEALQPLWSRHSVSPLANVRSIAAADFNSDGRPDIVTRLNSPHVVRVLLTNADGTLGTPVTIHTGTSLVDLTVADADGDGQKDVFFAESDGVLGVLMANGDGTFDAAVTTATGIAAPRISAADFNADGKADLAVRSATASSVAVYAGDGAGHLSLLFSRTLAVPPVLGDAGDIDGDGHADYVVGPSDGSALELNFGNGDGTFDAPVPLSGIAAGALRLVLGDLDADGDRELLIPNFNANTLTVVVNNGSRTFASPVVYNARPVPPSSGNPNDLFVADVNGDGDADVVMILTNEKLVATYTGNGDGSLNAGAYVFAGSSPWASSGFPLYVAAADFTGDGRVDLALAATLWVAIWKNVSGDVSVRLFADSPTITEGQAARFTVDIVDAQSMYALGYSPPPVTGTVTLRNNGVDVATAPVANGGATFEVPSLALGTHTITAHYSGDDGYRATSSAPVEQHVIAESTSVTVTSSRAGEEVPYSEWFTISATLTSEVGGPIDGYTRLYIDGVGQTLSGTSSLHWQVGYLAPGTHTFYVEYQGDATHPPATSNVITQVIKKADTFVQLEYGDAMVRQGEQDDMRVYLTGIPHGGTPGGWVRLYAGSALVSSVFADNSCCSGGMSVELPISLPPGVHYLRAAYEGDENHNRATSSVMRYIVVPNDGFVLHAWVEGDDLHAQALYELPDGGSARIYRRIANGPWHVVYQSPYASWAEYSVPAGVPYAFRIEAYNASNQLVATSNTEVVMRTATFTDDRVFAGMPIRAVHVAELVSATNTLRGALGLGPIAIGDAGAGNAVRASHFQQLRTAINEARVTIGGDAAVFLGVLQPGSPVKAAHIQELRDAIR